MEQLKHECGVVMIRLLKPLDYYKKKYGTYAYALNKLYLLMEKQHNRGQEGAGVGVVKLHSIPGHEYIFRERALGVQAITEIFSNIYPRLASEDVENMTPQDAETLAPFIGEIYMGHLRYSTTGKSGISYVHPFLRRNNWKSRNLLLCGNFNMTNVEEIFNDIVSKGQHPRIYSDTVVLLEQLGYALDKENHRVYRNYRDSVSEPQLTEKIEESIEVENILKDPSKTWDGGFVICGATGSGDMFALRDSNGIRPAFYYVDEEIAVVASERPVIQTVFNVPFRDVKELTPGAALIIDRAGKVRLSNILGKGENQRCSFERIYFSRGSDRDIYKERKALGMELAERVYESLNCNLKDAVFSFIPNTAEVAFIGLIEGLNKKLESEKTNEIMSLIKREEATESRLSEIMNRKLRVEKIAIKDIKLRTFIAEGNSREELATHVYDVTYGAVKNEVDTLVVIDDSIVRGTTLKQSIISMLDRLHPRKILVLSSSPQVRYPDYYGIDMSRMGEFIAFRAAVELIKERGESDLLGKVYENCKKTVCLPAAEQTNCVKEIYASFSDKEISDQIAKMLTPRETSASVEILYQTIDGLHKAIPTCPGDWYFSGNYPTPGGTKLVNQAYINYYEGNPWKR